MRPSASAPDGLLAPGSAITLENCHREPIATPGGIQPHGALLVVGGIAATVLQRSTSAASVLGVEGELLGVAVADVLGSEVAAELTEADPCGPRARAGTPAALRPRRVRIGGRDFDAVTYPGGPEATVIEFEPAGPAGTAVAVVDELAGLLEALTGAPSLEAMLAATAGWARALTGFDRVWIYRFESDGHGVVVAEDTAPGLGLEPFLGLHFPARDIPPQARALFLQNRVRVIGDTAAEPVGLEPLVNPATGDWTDLAAGNLRAVSPMHLRYLANLGATASMSIALELDGRLWGLVSGHHYSGPCVLEPRVRLAGEVLGRLASAQIAARLGADAAQARAAREVHREAILARLAAAEEWTAGLDEAGPALLGLCDADGAAIVAATGAIRVASTPPEPTVTALAERLGVLIRDGAATPVATAALADDVGAGLDLGPSAGLIAVPLARGATAMLLGFRDEWVHSVTWGDTGLAPAADRLSPHGSYRTWSESVRGRARPWSETDLEAARSLGAGIATVVVDQAERLARSNADLEAFSFVIAHDLREPLRNLQSFLGFFLEDHGDRLDADGAEQLDTVGRLATRMDGLLGSLLEHARVQRLEPTLERQTLATVVQEAVALLSPATRRARIRVADPDAELLADRDAMAHILTNLFTNAVKYARVDPPAVTVGVMAPEAVRSSPVPLARDARVVYVEDRGIGIAPEHREAIFDLFRRLHAREAYAGGSGAGLAIARRLARRQGGELWLEASTPGKGSRFCLSVPGPAAGLA